MKAVVVAHPDDEALWLSSRVKCVERIVFAFGAVQGEPQKSLARQRAVADLPLSGVIDCEIPESGVDWKSYQARATPGPTGIEIVEPNVRARYEANYARLFEHLSEALAGCSEVYTHNPWGEYGHPEHVQVHRAVSALQDTLGFTLWYSNYISEGNWALGSALARRESWSERQVVTPDRVTAHALRKLYRHHGAWTWPALHRWPALEMLYARRPKSAADHGRSFAGEWLLDVTRLRWGRSLWRSPRRLVPHLQGSPEHGLS